MNGVINLFTFYQCYLYTDMPLTIPLKNPEMVYKFTEKVCVILEKHTIKQAENK